MNKKDLLNYKQLTLITITLDRHAYPPEYIEDMIKENYQLVNEVFGEEVNK